MIRKEEVNVKYTGAVDNVRRRCLHGFCPEVCTVLLSLPVRGSTGNAVLWKWEPTLGNRFKTCPCGGSLFHSHKPSIAGNPIVFWIRVQVLFPEIAVTAKFMFSLTMVAEIYFCSCDNSHLIDFPLWKTQTKRDFQLWQWFHCNEAKDGSYILEYNIWI